MNCALQVSLDERESFGQVVWESWGQGILLINTLKVLSTGCEFCTWCLLFFCFNQMTKECPEPSKNTKTILILGVRWEVSWVTQTSIPSDSVYWESPFARQHIGILTSRDVIQES